MSDTTQLVTIRVKPRAHRDEVRGSEQEGYEVRVTVPPADGAANARALKLLAAHLGVAPSRLRIVAGHKARVKRIAIDRPPN